MVTDTGNPAYDAFISYRRSDGTAAARKLRRRLLGFRLPKALRVAHQTKLKIFMDTAYERGAADFYAATIKPALMAAKWLVIIATPDAVQRDSGDDWIAREVRDFTSGPNGQNVVVVRAKGELLDRMPADVGMRFPNIQIVDLRNDTLMARLSPQVNARLSDEIVKVAAPIFGISLEDMPLLRREEERKQMALLGGMAGFATTVVLATAAISIYTLQRQQEARAALDQSLQVTERNMEQLLSTYADEEPLDSASRQLVFNNCELAARLKTLGAASLKKSPGLLCLIEEGAVMEAANKAGEGMARIKSAIAEARQLQPLEGGGESIWRTVVKNGFATLALLKNGAEADAYRLDQALFAEADGDSALARLKMADDTEKQSLRDMAVRGWEAAAKLRIAVASQLPTEKWQERFAQYELAARLRAKILALLVPAGGLTTETTDAWVAAADAFIQPVLLTAQASQNAKQSAKPLIEWADEFLGSAALPTPASDRSKNVFRALLSLAAAGEPAIPETTKFAAAKAAVELARPEAVTENAGFQDTATGVVDDGLEMLAGIVDKRRSEIKTIAAADTYRAAHALATLIDEIESINLLRINPMIWDDYYVMIAQRDLAAYRMASGDMDEAESERLKARDIHIRWVGKPAQGELEANRAKEAATAWDDLWNGHHGRIDDLRAQAEKSSTIDAIRLLEQVIAEDGAWDAALGRPGVWDHVYEGSVRVQLAALYKVRADTAAANAQLARACLKLLAYGGKFELAENLRLEAERIWAALNGCVGRMP